MPTQIREMIPMECRLDIPERIAKITKVTHTNGFPHDANFKITQPEGYVTVGDLALTPNGFPLDGSCVPLDSKENDIEKYGFLGNGIADADGILPRTCIITVECSAVPKALTIEPTGGMGIPYWVNGEQHTIGEANIITDGLEKTNTIMFTRWEPGKRVRIKRVFIGQEYRWGADDIISATIDLQGCLSRTDFTCPFGEVELKVRTPVDEDAFTFAYTQNPIQITFSGHANVFNFYLADNGISLAHGIATIRGYDALQFLDKEIPTTIVKLSSRKNLPQQTGAAESIMAHYIERCGVSLKNNFASIASEKLFNGAPVYLINTTEARTVIGEAQAGSFKKTDDTPLKWDGAFVRSNIKTGAPSLEIYRTTHNQPPYVLTTDETTPPVYDFEQAIDGYDVEARYHYHLSTRRLVATNDDESGEYVEMSYPTTYKPSIQGASRTIFLGLDRAVFDKGTAPVKIYGHEIKERKYNFKEAGGFVKKVVAAAVCIAIPYRYAVQKVISGVRRTVYEWGLPNGKVSDCLYPSNRDFEPKTVKFSYYGHIGANIYDTFILTDLKRNARFTALAENVVYSIDRGGIAMNIEARIIKEEGIT